MTANPRPIATCLYCSAILAPAGSTVGHACADARVAVTPDKSPDTPVGLSHPGFRLARPGEAVPTPEDHIAREREEAGS